jgi:hypothetical protein
MPIGYEGMDKKMMAMVVFIAGAGQQTMRERALKGCAGSRE